MNYYRVPYLEFYLMLIDVNQTGAELDSDGEVVDGLESLVGELQEQATMEGRN